jgi:serine/threonine protein phosphatase 1
MKDQRRIIIGDIHGHYDGLMLLLQAISPSPQDKVYFLGDLIDRGPKSAQVVEFVQNSPYDCVLGNHEQLMLDAMPGDEINEQAWQGWLYSGGQATIASYIDAGMMPNQHLEWMRSLPLYIDLGDIWLVHAGVNPKLPLEKQSVEQFCWIRGEFHKYPTAYFKNKLIITGHTITFTFEGIKAGELVQGPGWLDIDTGVYHHKSGWLTGYDISYRRVYQVNVFSSTVRILPFDEIIKPVPTPHSSYAPQIFREVLRAMNRH